MNTIILFVVLTVFIFVVAYYWDKNYKKITDIRTYEDVEKLVEFDGDFQYRDDGFYIKLNDSKRFIKWTEIIQVTFKNYIVVGEFDTFYQIQTENETFEIDTEKSGFYKFKIKLDENLGIINNWQNELKKSGKEEIIFDRSFHYAN